jgi:hypothetical protein
MAENLLSISEVLLYGRVMEDVTYNYSQTVPNPPNSDDECDPPRPGIQIGGNALFQRQLAADPGGNFAPRFARIYGFSFEGCYYDLDAPIIMMVHGPGTVAERPAADQRAARGPESPDRSGNAAQGHSFAEEIRVWSYDKGDYSVRMDALTGTIEDILLDIELGHGGGSVSGGRVSGGRVSGGRVSGGRVSGGRVSGGRVSGGKDD